MPVGRGAARRPPVPRVRVHGRRAAGTLVSNAVRTAAVPAVSDLGPSARAAAALGAQLGADRGQAHVRGRGSQLHRARRDPDHRRQPEAHDRHALPALHGEPGARRRGDRRRQRGARVGHRDRPVAVDGPGERGRPQLRQETRDGVLRPDPLVRADRALAPASQPGPGVQRPGLAGGPRRGDHALAPGVGPLLQLASAVSRISRVHASSAPEARQPSTTTSVPSALTRTSGSTGASPRSSAVTAAAKPGACPMPPPRTTSSRATTVTTALIALATNRASPATTPAAPSSPPAPATKTRSAETRPPTPAPPAARATADADAPA